MLKLAPDVEAAQAKADALLRQAVDAISAATPALQGDAIGIDYDTAAAHLVPVLEQVRADERAACVAALENLDRTGREWVRGSLWASIFRQGIDAIYARGGVGRCTCISRPDLVTSDCPQHGEPGADRVGANASDEPVMATVEHQGHSFGPGGSMGVVTVDLPGVTTRDQAERLTRYVERRRLEQKGPDHAG